MTARKFGIDFEHLNLEGYRNINELYKQRNQLHACETLFGDWNAEVMLLAQDPANFNKLKHLHKNCPSINPYHHDPKIRTNQNLYRLIDSLDKFNLGTYDSPNNDNCGLYYANAIWLLKESEGMSGAITNREKAYEVNQEVFSSTLENLTKLKLILTLGEHSFNFIKYFFENQIELDWHSTVTQRKVHKVRTKNSFYFVGSIYHTSTRGMIGRAKLDGITGKNSCAKGIAISSEDLQVIFSSTKVL
jgi:hypothetical protein